MKEKRLELFVRADCGEDEDTPPSELELLLVVAEVGVGALVLVL